MLRLSSGKYSEADDATLVDILYRSDNFIAVSKRYDLKVNSDASDEVTVASVLSRLCSSVVDEHAAHGFRFIHRLDYATSGCLCIALTKKAARWGNKAFAKRYVTKHYLALVYGHVVVGSEGTISVELSIGCDSSVTDIHKMCTTANTSCTRPRHACTEIVLLQHGYYRDEPASKLLLIPHTGRMHQLRVHCCAIGHRVIGDFMYSDRQDVSPPRMMLHAVTLVIPMKHEHVSLTTPDPFTTELDPCWRTSETFTSYEKFCASRNVENPVFSSGIS